MRHTARKAYGGRLGEDAVEDLHQCKPRVLLHDDQVGTEHHLEATTNGHTIDRGDDGLEQADRRLEATETTNAEVLIHTLATRSGLQIPTGRKELLTAARQHADLEFRVVAQQFPRVVQRPTRRRIDRISLGPVEHHLKHAPVPRRPDCIAHRASYVSSSD